MHLPLQGGKDLFTLFLNRLFRNWTKDCQANPNWWVSTKKTKCPNNSWITEKRKEIPLKNFIYPFSAKNTHTGVPWAAISLKIEFLVFTSLANQFRGEKQKSRLYLSKRLIVSLLSKLSSSSFSFRFWKYLLAKLNAIFHTSFNS